MASVLITGGTGLLGQRLQILLMERGYDVRILCRDPKGANQFAWNIEESQIDEKAFENLDHIIHLAGAGVADKRWMDERKKELVSSRVDGAHLLFETLKKAGHKPQSFISASAVGYYGDRGNEILTEDSPVGKGFLSELCYQWEKAADEISILGIRVCKIRIGIVLSTLGGALPKLANPVRFGMGVYLGDGKQYYPWIHIEDICRIFIHALEKENMIGAYNGSAPAPVTNKNLTPKIAHTLGKRILPVPAPEFALRLVMGEMADAVLMSTRTNCDKILESGFQFNFPEIENALADVFTRKI